MFPAYHQPWNEKHGDYFPFSTKNNIFVFENCNAMKKTFLLLLLLPFSLFAQVSDDFSDGDFSQNPAWSGTDSCYTINPNFQLQLNANAAGRAYLSLPFADFQEMEWRFWMREAFSPSGNNYADVYLCSNHADLLEATKGYFLRFGESGSNDAITLFRKDSIGGQRLCNGIEAAIATSFSVFVKVNCDAEGNWTLQTCYDDSGFFATEAQCVDNTYPRSGYFGFKSVFTVSNAKRFYFDDVYIGMPITDTDPPVLQDIEVVDNQTLVISFNEAVTEVSALNPAHYSVNQGIGHPTEALFDSSPSRVCLVFGQTFANATNYMLHVENISDLAGNVMETAQVSFSIFQPSANDIVINEIMADPTPVVGLPEWEYVELYNTTDFDIDLEGWQFQIGNSTNTFYDRHLPPHGFLILCHANAVAELSDFGPCVGFSSFSINNNASSMMLSNQQGESVSQVAFTSAWYHDADKANGGWSVEQIDPLNPCAGAQNWTASNDASGGTPGRINSVDAPNTTIPVITRINVFSDRVIQLWFDQLMDATNLGEPSHYRIEENNANPEQVNLNANDPTFVELVFTDGFEQGRVYTLHVDNVTNCVGTAIEDPTTVQFGLPNEISGGEIVINEILFDPIAPGVDYIELYNASEKTFDLSKMLIGVVKESFPDPADTTMKEVSADSHLFLPHSYVLLSSNSQIVGMQYNCPTDNFVEMASFPNYPNSGATAIVMGKDGIVIDQMRYSEKMHHPLLKITKGVALERVSFDAPSLQPDNWHSAAQSVHFGTPGYENSMWQKAETSLAEISITPEVFSPDGDGFDDDCFISYHFDEVGCTMNIYIFNVAGSVVRHLVKGECVGTEGSMVWNGLDDMGNKVPIGIYVVITEVFNLQGQVKPFKNTVVVATK